MLARINEGGELRVYAVSQQGLAPQPRNWPRLLHEGTFSALWGSMMNLLVSLALLTLLATGAWIWATRQWRLRARRRRLVAPSGDSAELEAGQSGAPLLQPSRTTGL
jgi:uncharacterized iron-regulated membrane protein